MNQIYNIKNVVLYTPTFKKLEEVTKETKPFVMAVFMVW